MEFLTPWFWLGAAALGIPLLLHLVNKEKTRRIPFSSLMLVPRLPVKQMRRRRLENLLLLFLRCLGILLIVAAFARPVVNADWLGQIASRSSRSAVILIDNSFSMSRPGVWQAALDAAAARIESLGDSDEALLVQFAQSGEVISTWESSRPALLQVLESRARPSYEATSYLEGLRLAVGQFDEDRRENREVYLITDLQRNGLSSQQGWKIPRDVRFELKDVGENGNNLFIEDVRVERTIYSKEYRQSIPVRFSSRPPRELSGAARLYLEGEMVDRQTFDMGEQATGQITFKPFDLGEGVTRGRVVLEPEDDLPADNTFHFVVQRNVPSRVLILSEGSETATFYLEKALAAGQNLPFVVEKSRTLPADLDPSRTPLVILNDPKTIPAATGLKSFVEAGGGLIVILGQNTRSDAYSRSLGEILPARIVERKFVRSKQKPFTSITRVSWDHPIFSIFQDIHQAAVIGAQFFVYWKVEPVEGSAIVARFSEDDPAMVETSLGKGKVILFTSAVDPVWTDFPLKASFVPLWYQAARYAAQWTPSPSALRVGQIISPRGNGENGSESWTVLDPSGTRVLGIDETSTDSVPLKTPGFYEIRENKETDWIAANTPSDESDITRTSLEDFLAIFVPVQSRTGTTEVEVSRETVAREQNQSLWWLFLVAAGAVLFLESVLSNGRRSLKQT